MLNNRTQSNRSEIAEYSRLAFIAELHERFNPLQAAGDVIIPSAE